MDTRKATLGHVPLKELSLDLANLRTHIEWLDSGAVAHHSADEELGRVAAALWAIERKIDGYTDALSRATFMHGRSSAGRYSLISVLQRLERSSAIERDEKSERAA